MCGRTPQHRQIRDTIGCKTPWKGARRSEASGRRGAGCSRGCRRGARAVNVGHGGGGKLPPVGLGDGHLQLGVSDVGQTCCAKPGLTRGELCLAWSGTVSPSANHRRRFAGDFLDFDPTFTTPLEEHDLRLPLPARTHPQSCRNPPSPISSSSARG